MNRDEQKIKELAEKNDREGNQPFATEYLEKFKKPCPECGGTGKCDCLACEHQNRGDCLFCRPSKKIQAWRALPGYRARLGPIPPPGDGAHTPMQRYLIYLP